MSGLAVTTDIEVVQVPEIARGVDFCTCGLDCEYIEKAFAGSDVYKNDTSSFLYRKVRSADTVAIELHKKGNKVTDIVDNSLGRYYEGFSPQPLYVGFVVDWGKVFNTYGGGIYQIVANKVIVGTAITEASRKFYVNSYDDESANNTVRFDIVQNGNILADEFDYTDLLPTGWRSQFRIPARIEKDIEFIEDSYLTSDRTQANVQPSSNPSFVMLTHLIPAIIADAISENGVLADSIKLTNYDLLNPRQYTDLEVAPISMERVETANKREIYQVTFSRKKQNILKTF